MTESNLLSEFISPNDHSQVIVLFGGNPVRRDEVIRLLMTLPNVSVFGTLSEEEGIKTLEKLSKVDMVLIGGRYTEEQRIRIRTFIKERLPNTPITEPGFDYPYENSAILNDVKKKLKL